MEISLHNREEEDSAAKLKRQSVRFVVHSLLALGSWFALMLVGYAANPTGVPQWAILALSAAVPLCAGFVVNRRQQDTVAEAVWLFGLVWLLIIALWILDMPTGPYQCFHCGAAEKLSRTFFSLPQPSGLIDDDGPFLGTWPSAALVGYSIGARLAIRRKSR